jgi:hypothetical protein
MTSNPGGGHIVAMGGGGFSMEPDNLLLDDFVLALSRRHPPRVCFIPTASADSASYIVISIVLSLSDARAVCAMPTSDGTRRPADRSASRVNPHDQYATRPVDIPLVRQTMRTRCNPT